MKETKKALVLGEAFYPEDFLINDLVQEWEKAGYQLEVLTRSPSYPSVSYTHLTLPTIA